MQKKKPSRNTIISLPKALTAVKKDSNNLRYVSSDLKKNISLVLAAVRKNGLSLKYASKELKKNQRIVLAAVHQNGLSLQFADALLRSDPTVTLAAVDNNGKALKFVSSAMKKEMKLVLRAIQNDPSAVVYAAKSIQHSPKIKLASGLRLLVEKQGKNTKAIDIFVLARKVDNWYYLVASSWVGYQLFDEILAKVRWNSSAAKTEGMVGNHFLDAWSYKFKGNEREDSPGSFSRRENKIFHQLQELLFSQYISYSETDDDNPEENEEEIYDDIPFLLPVFRESIKNKKYFATLDKKLLIDLSRHWYLRYNW